MAGMGDAEDARLGQDSAIVDMALSVPSAKTFFLILSQPYNACRDGDFVRVETKQFDKGRAIATIAEPKQAKIKLHQISACAMPLLRPILCEKH